MTAETEMSTLPPPSPLRASDGEREATVARLHQALAEGRLDLAETEERVTAAYAARHRDELPPLLADLPSSGRRRETRHRHGTTCGCPPCGGRAARSLGHRSVPAPGSAGPPRGSSCSRSPGWRCAPSSVRRWWADGVRLRATGPGGRSPCSSPRSSRSARWEPPQARRSAPSARRRTARTPRATTAATSTTSVSPGRAGDPCCPPRRRRIDGFDRGVVVRRLSRATVSLSALLVVAACSTRHGPRHQHRSGLDRR